MLGYTRRFKFIYQRHPCQTGERDEVFARVRLSPHYRDTTACFTCTLLYLLGSLEYAQAQDLPDLNSFGDNLTEFCLF